MNKKRYQWKDSSVNVQMPNSCILIQQIFINQTIQVLNKASYKALQVNYELRQSDLCSK